MQESEILFKSDSESKKKNPYYKSTIQSDLNQLISEEWYAGQMYKLFINAVQIDEKDALKSVLDSIADDELDDHYANLIRYANRWGYSVPSTIDEFKKYAGTKDSKAFETFKNKKDLLTYIKLSIESELRAIAAYEEALENPDLMVCPEIEGVIKNNYYDELDHLQQLQFTQNLIDAEGHYFEMLKQI